MARHCWLASSPRASRWLRNGSNRSRSMYRRAISRGRGDSASSCGEPRRHAERSPFARPAPVRRGFLWFVAPAGHGRRTCGALDYCGRGGCRPPAPPDDACVLRGIGTRAEVLPVRVRARLGGRPATGTAVLCVGGADRVAGPRFASCRRYIDCVMRGAARSDRFRGRAGALAAVGASVCTLTQPWLLLEAGSRRVRYEAWGNSLARRFNAFNARLTLHPRLWYDQCHGSYARRAA
jgi:hypothetical protein